MWAAHSKGRAFVGPASDRVPEKSRALRGHSPPAGLPSFAVPCACATAPPGINQELPAAAVIWARERKPESR